MVIAYCFDFNIWSKAKTFNKVMQILVLILLPLIVRLSAQVASMHSAA